MNLVARALLTELAAAQCRCTVTAPSGMVSFCAASRKTQYHTKPQQPVDCLSCRARRALEREEQAGRETA